MVTECLYIIHILGEERVRAVLGEATKKDDLIKKSLLPRKSLYDKRSKSGYGAASSSSSSPRTTSTSSSSSSSSRTTSSSAGGSRSYRGKPGRGVNPTDKERRSSRGADRTKVNDEDEANSPERKRARRKGKGAGKRVSVFSLLFR